MRKEGASLYEMEKLIRLKEILKDMGSAAIGFSGGVDSTFLLGAAREVLGDRVLAITVSSSVCPGRELEEAVNFIKDINAKHVIVEFDVFKVQGFAENHKDRCYICKKEIFSKIIEIAGGEGFEYIVDGTNADDMGDYRPGMKAISELGVRSPLLEAGLTKKDIRILSREMNLPTWDKPSFACLASRIPYGQEITEEKLRMVELSEEFLMDNGFRQVRVRHHGEMARIEVSPDDRNRFFNTELMDNVAARLKEIGFNYVTLDLKGYRTGSMNEMIGRE